MKKVIFIFLFPLFLINCNGGKYYFIFDDVKIHNGELKNYEGKQPKNKLLSYRGKINESDIEGDSYSKKNKEKFLHNRNNSNISKKKCVYIISYFIPLNFWTYSTMKPDNFIKQIISESNSNYMRGINVTNDWFGSPIFSFDCNIIEGRVDK